MSATVHLRDATVHDLDAIVEIEHTSFGDPWTREMFTAHVAQRPIDIFLVAEHEHEIVGFAIAFVVADESELLDLAVRPDRRGLGIGTALLDAVCVRCTVRGATMIALDVRESNHPARALYASRGFAVTGRRRRYYQTPTEDALVLTANLTVSTGKAVIVP